MTIENRYIVLKRSDVKEALSLQQAQQLDRICADIKARRNFLKKPVLKCLVFESTWDCFPKALRLLEEQIKDRESQIEAVLNGLSVIDPNGVLTKHTRVEHVAEIVLKMIEWNKGAPKGHVVCSNENPPDWGEAPPLPPCLNVHK